MRMEQKEKFLFWKHEYAVKILLGNISYICNINDYE